MFSIGIDQMRYEWISNFRLLNEELTIMIFVRDLSFLRIGHYHNDNMENILESNIRNSQFNNHKEIITGQEKMLEIKWIIWEIRMTLIDFLNWELDPGWIT